MAYQESLGASTAPTLKASALFERHRGSPAHDNDSFQPSTFQCYAHHFTSRIMSTYTEMVSAQISEGCRSPLRGSIAGSTLGAMSPRRLSQDLVASFATNKSTSSRRLYELRLELDHQCLQNGAGIDLDTQEDPTLDVNSVKELAVSLSGALNECGYPGRCLFETLQLRALVSSLALLQSLGVTTLATETWDKLKAENIPARFGTITFQSNSISTLTERIRYTPNGYLIQLASQYLSFFRRGDSNLPSIIGPAIRLVFAGIAVVRRTQSCGLMSTTYRSF